MGIQVRETRRLMRSVAWRAPRVVAAHLLRSRAEYKHPNANSRKDSRTRIRGEWESST